VPVTSPDLTESPVAVTDEELSLAAKVIGGGGVVAFPTETFYGLAVDPFNNEALVRLFRLKDRSPGKPVLVLIDKITSLEKLVEDVPDYYRKLMDLFWPGPLTLVYAGRRRLPSLLTDAEGTVGIRLSSHTVARRLAAAAGGAVTGTSANPSGLLPAVTASQIKKMFPVGIDHIIDGGPVPGGLGSTIVGTDSGRIKLIRPGAIPYAKILAV